MKGIGSIHEVIYVLTDAAVAIMGNWELVMGNDFYNNKFAIRNSQFAIPNSQFAISNCQLLAN